VSIEIGSENGFDTIQWLNGPYFIKTETDPNGGINYTITGTSQILSVPYAMHAQTANRTTYALHAESADSAPITGNEPAFDGWDKSEDELWSQVGSDIYFEGGDVGIGNPNPSASLDVSGDVKFGQNGLKFSELRELTGTTHATLYGTVVTLPIGYNGDNIRVLSIQVGFNGTIWAGLGYDGGGGLGSVGYLINDSELYLYCPDIPSLKNQPYRILLLKID